MKKILSMSLALWILASTNIFAADASQEEKKMSMQTLLDPSILIARRTTVVGRLYWDEKDKSLYRIGTPSGGRPSAHCLPALVDEDNSEVISSASKLNEKDVRIDGIISYAAKDPGLVSITSCKQLGIYIIRIEPLDAN